MTIINNREVHTRKNDDNERNFLIYSQHLDPNKRIEVDEKTREEILSLIAHHVTAVNYIYRDTKFDGRNEHRNIKFEVQRIKVTSHLSSVTYVTFLKTFVTFFLCVSFHFRLTTIILAVAAIAT